MISSREIKEKLKNYLINNEPELKVSKLEIRHLLLLCLDLAQHNVKTIEKIEKDYNLKIKETVEKRDNELKKFYEILEKIKKSSHPEFFNYFFSNHNEHLNLNKYLNHFIEHNNHSISYNEENELLIISKEIIKNKIRNYKEIIEDFEIHMKSLRYYKEIEIKNYYHWINIIKNHKFKGFLINFINQKNSPVKEKF
jgi:hypothetical protein